MTCGICYEDHPPTHGVLCACGGAVDCAGNEAPRRPGWFLVACVACGRLFSVDAGTGARVAAAEPAMPGDAA